MIRLLLFLSFTAFACAQSSNDYVNPIAWVQTSAEYKATALQTYRSATEKLKEALATPTWTAALEQVEPDFHKLPPAVILDLDETVIDNSAMQARLVKEGKVFTGEEWARWVNEKRAGVVPGAVDFLKAAHSLGVAAFYITNRTCSTDANDPTRAVLDHWNIRVPSFRLLCRTDTGDKSPRRAVVARTHRVLLVIGDDFNDFVTAHAADLPSRDRLVETNQTFWGERWFMLSNPMYGSWERAVGMDTKAKIGALRQ